MFLAAKLGIPTWLSYKTQSSVCTYLGTRPINVAVRIGKMGWPVGPTRKG